MTIGTGNFIPQAKFSFPRSYIRGICLRFDPGAIITQHINYFSGYDSATPTLYFEVHYDARFHAWSSNNWTLDYIITENWVNVPPTNPTQIPFDFALVVEYRLGFGNYVLFAPGGLGTVRNYFDLPPAPPTYWKPGW